MNEDDFNSMFAKPYQGWKRAVAEVSTHPATALAIFVVVAIVVALVI